MSNQIGYREERLEQVSDPIFCRSWHPQEVKGCLVIVHGAAEHSGRYVHVGEYFSQMGLAVYALDLRGLGQSGGVRGHINSFSEYVSDVNQVVEKVQQEYPDLPLFLLGHSMGGNIAAQFGIASTGKVKGIILSSPAMGLKGKIGIFQLLTLLVLSKLSPLKVINSGIDPNGVCRDPEVVKKYIEDPLVDTNSTVSWIMAFGQAIKDVMAGAARFSYPVLIMQASADMLVDPAATRTFYDKIKSEDKTFKLWEGFYHEIINEPEKELVLQEMGHWLKARM